MVVFFRRVCYNKCAQARYRLEKQIVKELHENAQNR